MGTKFGENPVVSGHLKATHNGKVIYESESEQVTWYDRVAVGDNEPTRVKNNSNGYQYVTFQ